MALIDKMSNFLIPGVNTLTLFVEKFLIVVITTCLINITIILLNKNTREYIKVTLLKK